MKPFFSLHIPTAAALGTVLLLASITRASLHDELSVRAFTNPQFSNSLSDLQLQRLAINSKKQRKWLDIAKGELLAPVLVPRQIGSPGYLATQHLIVDIMTSLDYVISWDNFTATTPVGQVKMANIIATKNPAAAKRLVLAAHYESKVLEEGEFVGATDSAVPVALMLDVAKGLADKMEQDRDDLSPQLIFFDGEEAYEEWTDKDSIYGSKHLAGLWEHHPDPATVAALSAATTHKPELERVELMVLLDLIGGRNTSFVALELPTGDLFTQLSALEHRLRDAGHLSHTYLNTAVPAGAGRVEDDHVPFVERNVPVLHLISVPFPKVWHTMQDDATALDQGVVRDMSLLLRSFVASYLKLRV